MGSHVPFDVAALGAGDVGSSVAGQASPELRQARAARLSEESATLDALRSRMEAREARMARIDGAVNASRMHDSTELSQSTATVFGGAVPAAMRAGMPPGGDVDERRLFPSRSIEETPPDSARSVRSVPTPGSPGASRSRARPPPSASFSKGSPVRKRRGAETDPHSDSAVQPWKRGNVDGQRAAAGDAESERSEEEEFSVPWGVWCAAALFAGVAVGGCAGWLVGYGIYGTTTKGIAAKAVLSSATAKGGGQAAPVAVSAAAASATTAASTGVGTKLTATLTAQGAKGKVSQQAVGQALGQAEAFAATTAQTTMDTSTMAALATPYVTPAVAGSAGVGAGSVAVGAAVGGTAAGAAAVAVEHSTRREDPTPALK
eukprot:Hpha_TRINITY_DN25948_c0_g1::TRINITY_DN25948_c0_g1_i1::g.185466::m.185466